MDVLILFYVIIWFFSGVGRVNVAVNEAFQYELIGAGAGGDGHWERGNMCLM